MANGPTLPPQAYTREILAVAFNWLQSQPESIKRLAQSPDALVGLYLRAQRYGHASPEADAPVTSQNFVNDLKNLAEGLKQFDRSEPGETLATPILESQVPRPHQLSPQSRPQFRPAVPLPTALELGPRPREATPAPSSFQAPMAKPILASPATAAAPIGHSPGHSNVSPSVSSVGLSSGPMTGPSAGPSVSSSVNSSVNSSVAATATTTSTATTTTVTVTSAAGGSPVEQLNASSQAMIQEVKTALNLSSDTEVLNMMVALAYKKVRNLLT
ncbi:MAG: hypothetical protein NDI61_01095 [Bdellovibrionaceae bacterium]|nr:hypothetical protein [Pseudobdellovibrionaceae bacterium]